MGNPNAIAFSGAEDHHELPSDEDFKKAKTMIGEFLKSSSADFPHVVEMTGQIISRPTKDASPSEAITNSTSSAPKDVRISAM